ncbi:histidine--tRNA ligase [Selenomonas sp. TAMA-11512]|uniref:histidine--tRNA ligase n=1 Tax=Selenomonas sp. TAMA-11512 TaxID=3095337 RepID=UPI00308A4434|nr:histidine--tRNA ligase [Selenomonas sp. TAMA-11512]
MVITKPRGTKDILPDTVEHWLKMEQHIRTLCAQFGYQEIRTPMFEYTELFQRGIGDTTDVVEKEMYTFDDRGGKSLTLRPENTASVVRAYLENKLYADGGLTKLFYMGSMFRYDRPQAGRFREFHQFGVEALGESAPALDAEVVLLAYTLLETLGLTDLELHLNSVGCPNCRAAYRKALQEYFRPHLEKMCTDCKSRFERNPLRLLDCKNEYDAEISKDAPNIINYLDDDCRTHFESVQRFLTAAKVPFIIDLRLVRGLDYYTKTAFEIKYLPLGAQSAVAGGGRYDGLVQEIGGPAIPGIGFAVGLERALLALEKQALLKSNAEYIDVFFVALGDAAQLHAFSLLDAARKRGLKAQMDFRGRSMKAQMKQANKYGARFTAILGDDEIAAGIVSLRDMAKSEQETVNEVDLIDKICNEVDR